MEGKALQFLKKLGDLAEEVRLYFNSETEARVLKEIQNDYQLTSDDLDNLISDIFIGNFNFASLDSGLKTTKVPVSSQSKLAADILGKLFLPVAPFLKLDVKAEIIKRGHRPEIYKSYENDFNDLIADKNFEALERLVDLHESTYNPLEEESVSLDLFTTGLAGVLNDNDVSALASLNGGLIYLLINKPDFHNKINKVLLNNQEVITTQNLTWTEGMERGTVANWLKDFIRENGSDIYSAVVLSRYLATSANPQLLNETERRVVRRLLRTYRNLFFFPESMSDVPMEEWEIIPVEKASVEKPIMGARPKIEIPPVAENKVAPEVVKPKEAASQPAIVPQPPVAKAASAAQIKTESSSEDSELISLLTKYSPVSLETKAIKEEIKRRQKKS
jgi:hypothetical protein